MERDNFTLMHHQNRNPDTDMVYKSSRQIVAIRASIFSILICLEETKKQSRSNRTSQLCYNHGNNSMATLTGSRAKLFHLIRYLSYRIPIHLNNGQPLKNGYMEDKYVWQWDRMKTLRGYILTILMGMENATSREKSISSSLIVDTGSSLIALTNERARLFTLVQELLNVVPVPKGWDDLKVLDKRSLTWSRVLVNMLSLVIVLIAIRLVVYI